MEKRLQGRQGSHPAAPIFLRTQDGPLADTIVDITGAGIASTAVGFDPSQWSTATMSGLVVALAAVGGYSGTKNVTQHARKAS
jgi:hypothetical protein